MTIATNSSSILQNPSISQLTNGATAVYNQTNTYLLSPILNLGIAGIKLDIEEDSTLEENSEITDHYTEAGFSIQDNIVFQPLHFTLTGKVGEIVNYATGQSPSNFQKLTQKLTALNSYIPTLTNGMKELQNTARTLATSGQTTSDYAKAAIGSSLNFYQTFKKLNPPKTKQAQAVNFIRALRISKVLLSLQTPWTMLSNLLIESVTFTQNAESLDYTNITITFKEIRQAPLQYTKFDASKYQGKAANQGASNVLVGKAVGSKLSSAQSGPLISTLKTIANQGQAIFTGVSNLIMPNNKPPVPTQP